MIKPVLRCPNNLDCSEVCILVRQFQYTIHSVYYPFLGSVLHYLIFFMSLCFIFTRIFIKRAIYIVLSTFVSTNITKLKQIVLIQIWIKERKRLIAEERKSNRELKRLISLLIITFKQTNKWILRTILNRVTIIIMAQLFLKLFLINFFFFIH